MKWIKLFESYNKQDKINKANEIFCYFGLERTFTKSLAELTWVESRQVYIDPSSKTKVMFRDEKIQSLRISPTYVLKIMRIFCHEYVNKLQFSSAMNSLTAQLENTNFVVKILLRVLADFFELKIAIDTL